MRAFTSCEWKGFHNKSLHEEIELCIVMKIRIRFEILCWGHIDDSSRPHTGKWHMGNNITYNV